MVSSLVSYEIQVDIYIVTCQVDKILYLFNFNAFYVFKYKCIVIAKYFYRKQLRKNTRLSILFNDFLFCVQIANKKMLSSAQLNREKKETFEFLLSLVLPKLNNIKHFLCECVGYGHDNNEKHFIFSDEKSIKTQIKRKRVKKIY